METLLFSIYFVFGLHANLCGCGGLEYAEFVCCKQNADIVGRKESGESREAVGGHKERK